MMDIWQKARDKVKRDDLETAWSFGFDYCRRCDDWSPLAMMVGKIVSSAAAIAHHARSRSIGHGVRYAVSLTANRA